MGNILFSDSISIYRGSSKTINLTVMTEDDDGEPIAADLTGAKVIFSVKRNITDNIPILQKISTSISQINIVLPREGKASIYLTPPDTKDMLGDYVYDVWVELASGNRYPVVVPSGFEVKPGVTILL